MTNGQNHSDHRSRRKSSRRKRSQTHSLSECRVDSMYTIIENQDKQSMEMGLFSGARVRVIHNAIESPNMVVAINESRYMLNKETARHILVK